MASKLTESAKGRVCQLRLEGCLPGTKTVIAAHLNGGGMGTKVSDLHIMYACMNCHDLLDGRTQASPPYEKEWLELEAYRAVIRTQRIMLDEGIIKV